jgi:hypothetical protein
MAKGSSKTKKIIEVSVTSDQVSQELVTYVEKYPEISGNQKVMEIFNPIFIEIGEWEKKIKALDISGGTNAVAMAQADEAKKIILKVRTGLKKAVDEQIDLIKEDMAPYQKAISAWQQMRDFTTSMISRVEEQAKEKAKFLENEAKRKKDELRDTRIKDMVSLGLNAYMPPLLNLAEISEEEYQKQKDYCIKLKNIDDDDKKKKEQESEAERKQNIVKLRTSERKLDLIKTGLSEDENQNMIYGEIIIATSDIQDMEDEQWNMFIEPIKKEVEDLVKKAKDAESERIKKLNAEAEAKERVQKTREYLLKIGMELDSDTNTFQYDDFKIDGETLEGQDIDFLRNLMKRASEEVKKIKDENEAERIRIENEQKEKREKLNQLIAQRLFSLKNCEVAGGKVIYKKEVYSPENNKPIIKTEVLLPYEELGQWTAEEFKDYVSNHNEKVKTDISQYEQDYKKEMDRLDEIKRAKAGDNEKLKEYADKLFNIVKSLGDESFKSEASSAFAQRICDNVSDIVDKIDDYIKK